MSTFKFNIFDRVIVPDENGAQGVVTDITRSGSNEPRYTILLLKVIRVEGEDVALPITAHACESCLVAVQPPKTVTEAEASKLVDDARQEVTAELGNKIAELLRVIDHLHANALRRAKLRRAAARKAKRSTRARKRR